MATKTQVISKAKKLNVKIQFETFSDGLGVYLDACNQVNRGYGGHGFTAGGDTWSEAYQDATNWMSGLVPCAGCDDPYCKLTDEQIKEKLN